MSDQFGEMFLDYRLSMGMTARAFGRLTGISHVWVRRLETGRARPTLEIVEKLCRHASLPVRELGRRAGRIVLDAERARLREFERLIRSN